jgi:hypothetical protein
VAETLGEIAKLKFRDYSEHMRVNMMFPLCTKCGPPVASRQPERYRTVLSCPCGERWFFSDASLREASHILDYLATCDDRLREPILNFKPFCSVWSKVLLGFLDESEA